MKYEAVFFDLDGTLLDSAIDLIGSINDLLTKYQRPACDFEQLRPYISLGSYHLLELAFKKDFPIDAHLLRKEFLSLYSTQNTKNCVLFAGIEALLDGIEARGVAWGIITNKFTQPTEPIIRHLQFDQRASAIVCGDTLPVEKPDPSPLLLACKMTGVEAKNCVYIGDSHTDILAGNLAEMTTIGCAYGYINPQFPIHSWKADFMVDSPDEILPLLLTS